MSINALRSFGYGKPLSQNFNYRNFKEKSLTLDTATPVSGSYTLHFLLLQLFIFWVIVLSKNCQSEVEKLAGQIFRGVVGAACVASIPVAVW